MYKGSIYETYKSCNPLERDILPVITNSIRNILNKVNWDELPPIEEIRLRGGKPLMIQGGNKDWTVTSEGLVKSMDYISLGSGANGNSTKQLQSYLVSPEEILKTIELISENSIYSFQEELKNGFITISGGHRIGIVGKIVPDGKNIRNIKNFSGINIRVARQVPGSADKVLPHLVKNRNEVYSTLIISPPQCGKTTLLRDLIRQISDGNASLCLSGQKVGLADERSEIAACFKGIPQLEVGMRTDVLDGCYKSMGMTLLLRSMSPRVIATDEIGSVEDMDAIRQVLCAGVKIIATIHGEDIEDIRQRYEIGGLIKNKAFERYILLNRTKGPGTVAGILDGTMFEPVT